MGLPVGRKVWYGTVREWFKKQGKGYATFVECCLQFGEPDDKKQFGKRTCPGLNCLNLLDLPRSLAVQRWLWHFHEQFQWQASANELSVVLFCDNGVRRSVGVAILLEWCLNERGCKVTVEHMAKAVGGWGNLRCPGTCDECQWKTRPVAELCAAAKWRAMRAWQSVREGSESFRRQLTPRTEQGAGPHARTSGPGLGPRARAPRVAIPVASQPNRYHVPYIRRSGGPRLGVGPAEPNRALPPSRALQRAWRGVVVAGRTCPGMGGHGGAWGGRQACPFAVAHNMRGACTL